MVAKATLPPASFCTCLRKSMTSQPEEITTERWMASCRFFNVAGLLNVRSEITWWASEAITTC